MKKVRNEMFGVDFVPRGERDYHICFQLMLEDDGHWFPLGHSVSSAWIDDAIEALQLARQALEIHAEADTIGYRQYGFKFKECANDSGP